MANKPVMGMYICPECKKKTPIVWNGNVENKCVQCGIVFMAKRQKILPPIQLLPKQNI